MRRLLLPFIVLPISASAQVQTAPTSIPIEKTIHALFEGAKGPCSLESEEIYSNFRLLLNYDASDESKPRVTLLGNHAIDLPTGDSREVEIAFEQIENHPARVRVWHEGLQVEKGRDLKMPAGGAARYTADQEKSTKVFRFDRDFTVMVKFKTKGGGTLVAKSAPKGPWTRDAKALFLRNGRLVYDIGWLGSMTGKTGVNDGKEHVAVLVVENGNAKLVLDGKLEAEKGEMTKPDQADFVFKVGTAAEDFGGDFSGKIRNVRFWKRALSGPEVKQLSTGQEDQVNTPDYNWKPTTDEVPGGRSGKKSFGSIAGYATAIRLNAGEGFQLKSASVQPLAKSDHAELVKGWDQGAFDRGKAIYGQLCVTCHGTLETPGSLPTALRFHEGQFKNGADPYRMWQTLEKGYGMMIPQPQYTTAQKYDLIHYIREEFLKGKNESQMAKVDGDYFSKLPRGLSLKKEVQTAQQKARPYLLQDYGNVLFWTMQVENGNIAQKGIVMRVDEGEGGVSKGRAWMLYDHDTMRLAACWTGDKFVDWRGIAFDGSHGTHTSIVGEKHFVFPNEPMWANPKTGDYEDVRILGRDKKPYGPLPGEWVKFKGLTVTEENGVLRYTVGGREIAEIPRWDATTGTFERVMFVAPSSTALEFKLGNGETYKIGASKETGVVVVRIKGETVEAESFSEKDAAALGEGSDLAKALVGFKAKTNRRFPGVLATRIERGTDEGPFAVDVLTPPAPAENPWKSWMRTSGFDFFKGGKSAAVCTWNGDVWIVDGIDQSEGTLQWQRICAGLFQPLGLRIVDGEIYVGCRDMIAKLVDQNGDRETDYIEAFNNDHQVTEHFHEFAMGLQTDKEGNFYYAKSARHAKTAVVPHHGTLLKVSKDGSTTEILATGFRAANGVCLNPDGSFIVTDQEGHWNPKNRINWVKGTGKDDFYGNMYGYHDITDESDDAMVPPLCWITNGFDRSPAELLWVPEDSAWKTLRGSLLNLSYGHGQVYVVPHEKVGGLVQGGMCALPFKKFPTGVMRGRFHPGDGQLYGCGMFAWAGNQRQPGGFYRIRYTGKPAYVPVGLATAKRTVDITFTDPLDREASENPAAWKIDAWDLKRTKGYGSKHYNQRTWQVEEAKLSRDGKTVRLTIPDLAPTWGMSINCKTRGADGTEVRRLIHNSIYTLKN